MSVKSPEGSKIILHLNTTGLQTGSTYRETVNVISTGGIQDSLPVTLLVKGQCNATSASVSPSSLRFETYVGNTPDKQTLYVRDNCGNALDATATVSPGSDWLIVSKTGTGTFSVSCNTSGLSVGDYNGTITLEDKYGQHNVDVALTVTDTPTSNSYSDGSVTLVPSGSEPPYYINLGPGQIRYFTFTAGVRVGADGEIIEPILVGTTGRSSPFTVHLLLKQGSKPTIEELNYTYNNLPPNPNGKSPEKGLYWKYSNSANGEMVEVKEPMKPATFYFMLYNSGDREVRGQQLTVSYDDSYKN